MRGTSHEYEPEVEALVYVDFEFEYEGGRPSDSMVRYTWTIDRVHDVLWEVHGGQRNTRLVLRDLANTLVVAHTTGEDAFDLDEVKLWEAVERYANAQGFDTYNSDTRFEVYPAETPAFDPQS